MTRQFHVLSGGVALWLAWAAPAPAAPVVLHSTDGGGNEIILGVHDHGHLNVPSGTMSFSGTPFSTVNDGDVGLARLFSTGPEGQGFYDATSPGCLCEGWGVSASGAHLSTGGAVAGYANEFVDGGPVNLIAGPLSNHSESSVTTTVNFASDPGISVIQAYNEAIPGILFQNQVTITNNTGLAIDDVRYVRVMDWDIPFNEFNEFVTIEGTAAINLERSHNDGKETANPLVTGDGPIAGFDTLNKDFTDAGPADHGAYFRFNFGTLADGESVAFNIFHGAAPDESAAFAALTAVDAELFSFGQSSSNPDSPTTGAPATFILAFSGVGGQPIPEPGTFGLAVLGLVALGLAAWRRNRAPA